MKFRIKRPLFENNLRWFEYWWFSHEITLPNDQHVLWIRFQTELNVSATITTIIESPFCFCWYMRLFCVFSPTSQQIHYHSQLHRFTYKSADFVSIRWLFLLTYLFLFSIWFLWQYVKCQFFEYRLHLRTLFDSGCVLCNFWIWFFFATNKLLFRPLK